MNTASNVISFDNQTANIAQWDTTTPCNTNTVTVTDNISWPYYHYYPVIQKDEVSELKAWISGFMEGRKMTEKNIARIQKKLEEFSS